MPKNLNYAKLLTSLTTCRKLGKLNTDGNISRCENCEFVNEPDCFSSLLTEAMCFLMRKQEPNV